MKVVDVLEKVDDLKALQARLREIAERDHTWCADANIIEEARDAIDLYIRELLKKDVKE